MCKDLGCWYSSAKHMWSSSTTPSNPIGHQKDPSLYEPYNSTVATAGGVLDRTRKWITDNQDTVWDPIHKRYLSFQYQIDRLCLGEKQYNIPEAWSGRIYGDITKGYMTPEHRAKQRV